MFSGSDYMKQKGQKSRVGAGSYMQGNSRITDMNKMQKIKKEILDGKRTDLLVLIATIFLCAFGLIMIYSASYYECSLSKNCNYDPLYYMKRQVIFIVLGFLACVVLWGAGYNWIKRLVKLVYAASIVSILLLLTPLGIEVNGAVRWLNIGVQFQVAEFVKAAVIVMLAYYAGRHMNRMDPVKLMLHLWVLGGIPTALLFVISSDLSSSIVVLAIIFGISFVATKTFKWHLSALGIAIGGAAFYVMSIAMNMPEPDELQNMSFRVARIAAWLDPEKYASGAGYQVLQSLYAIGSGGWTGKGLGNSVQKLGAIPEGHTDMIFSIICEELGLLGAVVLISLFVYLLYQIYIVVISSRNIFGSLIALGVLMHIGVQSLINVFVNVNAFPNTGITLPFISYGGTAVAVLLAEIGLVMSIARRGKRR